MKHYNIKIYGKVQGINFRTAAREWAAELKVAGFVRNESDGSVFIEVEGDDDKLAEFLARCHDGPALASVEQVEFEESAIKGYNTFVIN